MNIVATHIHPARRRRALPVLLPMLLPVLMPVLMLLGIVAHAHAQTLDPMTAGRTYFIAFPDTTNNTYDQRQDTDTKFTPREPRQDSVFIYIFTAAENTVDITDDFGYSKRLTMTANSSHNRVRLRERDRSSSDLMLTMNGCFFPVDLPTLPPANAVPST